MDDAEGESGQSLRPTAGSQRPGQLENRSAKRAWRGSSSAAAFAPVLAECDAIHKRILQGRVFHRAAHARGRWQVHTNIPVNFGQLRHAAHGESRRGEDHADRARAQRRDPENMASASTKLEYLTEANWPHSAATRLQIDPEGHFNKHKLMPQSDLRRAYTPSFGLLGHEFLDMQQSDISSISDAIKDCLRCGKCKPVCATHVPRANLLYSPPNKILGNLAADRGSSIEGADPPRRVDQHWDELSDVADHSRSATSGATPCPVGIDFRATSPWACGICCAHGTRSASISARPPRCFSLERHQSADDQGDAPKS